ncbi:MAG: RNA methyltransferase [Firmicutes bacterium]|nr:RNA methyltransferase [Bacillota bacterium]
MIIPTDQLNTPELSLYGTRSEGLLKHFYEPQPGLFIAETTNVILAALHAGYEPVSLAIDERLLQPEKSSELSENTLRQVKEILSLMKDLPIHALTASALRQIAGVGQTRGILCALRRRQLPSLESILLCAERIAVLEDVENPTNVGAIFRAAAGIGFDAVVLTFGSSDPLYRRAARVSMGSVFQIPWTSLPGAKGETDKTLMKALKEYGFTTVAMALTDGALPLDDAVLPRSGKLAVFFGNEENGLLPTTIEACDFAARIPMLHGVDSLNVAAASAIAFWELRKR